MGIFKPVCLGNGNKGQNEAFTLTSDWLLVKLPVKNYTVSSHGSRNSFLLVLTFISQLASWQGTTDWGEGFGLVPGLGAGRSKRNNKQFSINLRMGAEFFP